jgi:hypothetical protein
MVLAALRAISFRPCPAARGDPPGLSPWLESSYSVISGHTLLIMTAAPTRIDEPIIWR